MKPDGEFSSDMEAENVDPNIFFLDTGMLILEGRLPEFTSRGRKEGFHCPQFGLSTEHICDTLNDALCKKAELFRSQMQLLYKNSIPMMVEVLLFPPCAHGFLTAQNTDPTPSISEDVVLLERWTVQMIPKRISDYCVGAKNLLLAVRSYLHFSQLSAWLSRSNGKLPQNIVHRICVPGETGTSRFVQSPESHTFPSPNLNKTCSIKVTVEALQRQTFAPMVNCSLCVQESELNRLGIESYRKVPDINRPRDGPSFRKKEWTEACDCPECQLSKDEPKTNLLKTVRDILESSKQNLCKYITPCSSPTELRIRNIKDVLDSSRSSIENSLRSSPINFRAKGMKDLNESTRYEVDGNTSSWNSHLRSSPITIKSKIVKDSPHTEFETLCKCNSPRVSPLHMKAKTMKDVYELKRNELENLSRFVPPSSPARRHKVWPCYNSVSDLDSSSPAPVENLKFLKYHHARTKRDLTESDKLMLSPKLRHCEFLPDSFSSTSIDPIIGNLHTELSLKETEEYLHHLQSSRYPYKMKSSELRGSFKPFDQISNVDSQLPFPCNKYSNFNNYNEPRKDATECGLKRTTPKSTPRISNSKLPLRTLNKERKSKKLSSDKTVTLDSKTNNELKPTSLSSFGYQGANILSGDKFSKNVDVDIKPQHPTNIYLGLSNYSTSSDIMQINNNPLEISENESSTVTREINANEICLTRNPLNVEQSPDRQSCDPNDNNNLEDFAYNNSNLDCLKPLHLEIPENQVFNDTSFSQLSTPNNSNDLLTLPNNVQFPDAIVAKTTSCGSSPKEFLAGFRKGKPLLKQLLSKGKNQLEENLKDEFQPNRPTVPTAQDKAKFRRSLDSATSMVFHTKTRLPLTSSPAPLRRGHNCFEFDNSLITVQAIKSALCDNESEEYGKLKKILSTSAPASTSTNGLLGNFEESVLNGRLEPVGAVEGFSAEIGASGTFCPSHVRLPVTTFFYQLSDDLAASPYLGHINLESLAKKAYHIPKKGTIQVTLFNPNNTVVKMFVVVYDLFDMPPSMQTFLRQRTYYMPVLGSTSPLPNPKWLRYLIHLRFVSTKSGKIYLHTDIRLMFSRKSEIDATIPSKYELRSFTEGPINPKFSPRRFKKGSIIYI